MQKKQKKMKFWVNERTNMKYDMLMTGIHSFSLTEQQNKKFHSSHLPSLSVC